MGWLLPVCNICTSQFELRESVLNLRGFSLAVYSVCALLVGFASK